MHFTMIVSSYIRLKQVFFPCKIVYDCTISTESFLYSNMHFLSVSQSAVDHIHLARHTTQSANPLTV